MPTETATQGWDSRFDDSNPLTASSASAATTPRSDAISMIQQIAAAVRNELPFISPNQLEFHSCLGQGSSFEVTQETYATATDGPNYVAVKRIVTDSASDGSWESDARWHAVSKRLANVMREVRILTHPTLQSHARLASAIGWGLTPGPFGVERLYLIMPLSHFGALSRFAQNRALTITDRRFLALDVALGLRALHENGIVHGDVKLDNVLVYEHVFRNAEHESHYIARLADFGCAIFEKDLVRTNDYYLGTAKYNAPEIRGLFRDDLETVLQEIPRFDRYKAADCYSFGLLLWEIIKEGESFIEPDWLDPGEHTQEFLEREFHRGENALLGRANQVFRDAQNKASSDREEVEELVVGMLPPNPTRNQLASYLRRWSADKQLDELDAPPAEQSFEALRASVAYSLRDDIRQRGVIQELVKLLSRELKPSEIDGSTSWGSILRHGIPIVSEHRTNSPAGTQQNLFWGPTRILRLDSLSSHNVRLLPPDAKVEPDQGVARVNPPKRVETITVTPQEYQYHGEDMLKSAMGRQPPWEAQCKAANFIQQVAQSEEDPTRRSQANLQLAIMLKIGYGMPPDILQAMRCLREASDHNEVARAIYGKVFPVLDPEAQDKELLSPMHPVESIIRGKPLVFHGNVLWRGAAANNDFVDVGPISVSSFEVLSILVKKGRYSALELSQALTAACRDGLFDEAMLLAGHCTDLSEVDLEMPNPLHWLVMFSPAQALQILQALASTQKSQGRFTTSHGSMRYLLAGEAKLTPVTLPHRGLMLQGNPLHWAVTAGYVELCEAFLSLGADINARTEWRRIVQEGSRSEHHPSLSPLDLAAVGHHPQITKLLLDHGAEVYGGDWYLQHSPLHVIGYDVTPFARYMLHGHNHRRALRETIRLLLDRGLDINDIDSLNQTPLLTVVKSLDIEPYVLEELISAGASAVQKSEEVEGPLVSSAVVCCAQRRYSAWKITCLLPLTKDVNAGSSNGMGLNALHHCALFDAVPAANILLGAPSVDVNAESRKGHTAIQLAVQRGSLGVLSSLIRHRADLGQPGLLSRAISGRQLDALAMLLNAGVSYRFETGSSTSTILHYAARHLSDGRSCIRECLEKCPQLRVKEVLNERVVRNGATPLHNATCLGDLDGVTALLEEGADPFVLGVNGAKEPHQKTALQLARETKAMYGEALSGPHPSLRPEIQKLPEVGRLERIRAIEMDFMDRMTEIIRVLERAERSWVD